MTQLMRGLEILAVDQDFGAYSFQDNLGDLTCALIALPKLAGQLVHHGETEQLVERTFEPL